MEPDEATDSDVDTDTDEDTEPDDGTEQDEDSQLSELGILRPLLMCKRLRELRLHASGPFILSTSILEEIGAAWPHMEELVLCPDPNNLENPRGTPISRLPQIATAFPRIRLLGLYFDNDDSPASACDLFPEIQFQCLRELNVGASPVPGDDTAAVGLYLASIFAVGTRPTIKAEVSGALCSNFHGYVLSEEWEAIDRLVHRMMPVKEAVFCRISDH